MGYYTINPPLFQRKNMNKRKKSPSSINHGAIRGLFCSFVISHPTPLEIPPKIFSKHIVLRPKVCYYALLD